MNFWQIFLFLLIGAVVGYEFGKAAAIRRIRSEVSNLAEKLKKTADAIQKKAEEEERRKELKKEKEHVIHD